MNARQSHQDRTTFEGVSGRDGGQIEVLAKRLAGNTAAAYGLMSRPPLSHRDADTLRSWLAEMLKIALFIRLPARELCQWTNSGLAEFERRVRRSPGPRVTSLDVAMGEARLADD